MQRGLMREYLHHICKLLFAVIFGVGITSTSLCVASEKKVTALVYDFPPYYQAEEDGSYSGIGIELLRTMSKLSPDYEFEITSASPRRRHDIFKNKNIDISLFDQMSWGWQEMRVDHTDIYMYGGERYIAAKRSNGEDDVFDNIIHQRLAGILGYHYKFADFKSDPLFLREHFNIELVAKQDQIIKMVSSKRVDIGVVTEAYFLSYLARRPSLKDEFEISPFYDQKYNFVGIRSLDAEIPLAVLNELVVAAVATEDYQAILGANGLLVH